MKIAIVHDWLIAGGAERVVYELHKIYPDAPIYTSYCTPDWQEKLDGKVRTGFLQRWPFPKIRKFVPFLRIWYFTRLDLSGYDLVISTSGAEAKGINTPPDIFHLSYIHAPTHYYWSRYEEYMKNPGFGSFDWLARIGLRMLVGPLRKWDYKAAHKADFVMSNSSHTSHGVKKYYDIDSKVLFPPVNTDRFRLGPKKRAGFVVTGRQTPYKRIDLAVQACTELELPLTVIGTGPDHERLKKMGGPTINFVGFVSDEEVVDIVSSAEGFLFCGVDDFGIAPVEALASGTPVIAYKAGGALDYVNDKTGIFFEEQTVEAVIEALKAFDNKKYSPGDIKKFAERFSNAEFAKNIHTAVKNALD